MRTPAIVPTITQRVRLLLAEQDIKNGRGYNLCVAPTYKGVSFSD